MKCIRILFALLLTGCCGVKKAENYAAASASFEMIAETPHAEMFRINGITCVRTYHGLSCDWGKQ